MVMLTFCDACQGESSDLDACSLCGTPIKKILGAPSNTFDPGPVKAAFSPSERRGRNYGKRQCPQCLRYIHNFRTWIEGDPCHTCLGKPTPNS